MKSIFIKSRHAKVGAVSGTLVHVDEQRSERTLLRVTAYDAASLNVSTPADAADIRPQAAEEVLWVNVDGLRQMEVIETLGRTFNMSVLVLEDILNTDHRPKLEIHDDFLFIVVKMLAHEPGEEDAFRVEQLSLVVGGNFLAHPVKAYLAS